MIDMKQKANIPVIMYHALSKEPVINKYIIEEKRFLDHMSLLYANNYKTLLIDEYYDILISPDRTVPPKSIIVTFDDGHESNYFIALPLLKKYNYVANFFITTDWIGKTGYMNSDQLKLLKEEGMSIHSHAKTHIFLDSMNNLKIREELQQSKIMLEDMLGKEVSFISFPGGRYNDKVIDYSRESGYKALLTSEPNSLKLYDNTYLIGRFVMRQTTQMDDLGKILHMDYYYILKQIASYKSKYLLKKAFGNDFYYYLWRKFIRT